MAQDKHIAAMPEETQSGEKRTVYQGKTGRDNPFPIPKDTGAQDEVFSGPTIDNDNIVITGYRVSPALPMRDWRDVQEGHPPGERPGFIHFGGLDKPAVALNEVLPDAIGLGEGEATPFSAQRGEMPEGEGKYEADPQSGKNFVQARKPVKSDVPANR